MRFLSPLMVLLATSPALAEAGELPVDSQTRLAAVASGDDDPYVPVVGRMADYSKPFLQGIDKAMALLPKDRIGSANDWADLLQGKNAAASAKSKEHKVLASKPASGAPKKGKTRLLGGIALVIPIIGAVYALQGSENAPATNETTATFAIAEPTQTAAAAVPTPAVVPVPSEDEAPTTDLSAILNLPAAPAQPEATPQEALEAILAEPTEDATLEDAVVAVDTVPTEIIPAPEFDLANILEPTVVEDVDPAPAVLSADDEIASISASLPLETAALEATQPALASEPLTETPFATPELLIENFDVPQVVSAWSVDLTDALPVPTDKVFAINGVSLEANSEIDAVLHETMQASESNMLELSVLAGASESDATVASVTVPVIHKTSFPDGTIFESRMIDGGWATVVTDVPAGSEFAIGDTLVGDVGTETMFDKRTSLPDILVEANAQDLQRLTLAIRRDGTLSVTSMLVPR